MGGEGEGGAGGGGQGRLAGMTRQAPNGHGWAEQCRASACLLIRFAHIITNMSIANIVSTPNHPQKLGEGR